MKKLFCLALILSLFGCASDKEGRDEYEKTKKGAGIGAAVGAVAGAIVSKDKKKGAVIGGAIGGMAGGVYGQKLDEQAKELEEIAETKRTDKGIVTKLKGDITFETGKARLRPEARQNLKKIAEIFKKYPENEITVVGHTDSTGPEPVNEQLSIKRAEAVQRILTQNGVPSTSVNTIGVADNDPIASNQTSEGRAANRRVELAITMDEEGKSQRRAE